MSAQDSLDLSKKARHACACRVGFNSSGQMA
ncbi:hypothetical protein B0B36_30195 [Pseudomonas syringae pv. actinidifoliorum]|nr:hypothetical protein [Pseudomonas syringae]MCF5244606.1 hypothetical protein [Pseudomonas syringae]NAT17892.1 hypothetical protein [Pseudomonas syringae pv. actinidifoliorum]NAT61751.1 hypothetical protein [Pseudomonas syringae pv. actinidifoliorum]OOK93018.1 hypothetical protein B0B36_30195 [Pseudomonas syringae pv. actinidifoliorum]